MLHFCTKVQMRYLPRYTLILQGKRKEWLTHPHGLSFIIISTQATDKLLKEIEKAKSFEVSPCHLLCETTNQSPKDPSVEMTGSLLFFHPLLAEPPCVVSEFQSSDTWLLSNIRTDTPLLQVHTPGEIFYRLTFKRPSHACMIEGFTM